MQFLALCFGETGEIKVLCSGRSKVASLKREAIDGRPPPGVELAAQHGKTPKKKLRVRRLHLRVRERLHDALEENYMTVYVKTINGKTISFKCDKKQKAAMISDEVERKSSIPRHDVCCTPRKSDE